MNVTFFNWKLNNFINLSEHNSFRSFFTVHIFLDESLSKEREGVTIPISFNPIHVG
jgi:hypothetical protein